MWRHEKRERRIKWCARPRAGSGLAGARPMDGRWPMSEQWRGESMNTMRGEAVSCGICIV
eukprot:scaffold10482_cov116-Isochrysis_galbana.AAC.6